ncbi:hypothetical protein RIF29_32306 [Crotalaria pallida]|uniref:Uncharacterized protein n=1 Tax=Crotalaria pallida TaxID=3830 RepID=A0AAN9ENA3_CROPI
MEASLMNTKSNFHARSNSLPSRPHPLILQCNEHLERLIASQETSSSPSLLSHKLGGLQDLHDCVEKLVQLPQTKEALLEDELLDASLRLLDVCTATKDSLLHKKECMRELQSMMRRRKCGEVELKAEVKKFLNSRQTKKVVVSSQLEDESEFAQLDELLQSYIISNKHEKMNKLQNHLEKLESLIQDLEEGLECLFRLLIKIRVSLLNILNR